MPLRIVFISGIPEPVTIFTEVNTSIDRAAKNEFFLTKVMASVKIKKQQLDGYNYAYNYNNIIKRLYA